MKMHGHKKGFSIVELLVASALFITVVSVAAGSFLSTLDSAKRARELQELSSNLDFALEDMSRNIRTAVNIDPSCGGSSCEFTSRLENGEYDFEYDLVSGRIEKSQQGPGVSLSDTPLTTDAIDVTSLEFTLDDGPEQPRVIINLVAETTGNVNETFYLQTSITQRALDN